MQAVPRAAALLLLLAAGALPLAHAQGCNGLGVTPITIDVPDAQQGQAYRHVLSVQNPCGFTRSITSETTGDVAVWTTLTPATFDLAPNGHTQVEVLIHVPDQQGPGSQLGYARFVSDAGAGPTGSGQSVSAAVAVPINVTVGGIAVEKIVWGAARVEDAPEGDPVHAFATARNEGNVRTTATARGQVLPFTGNGTLKEATGSLALGPGEEKEVPVTFPAGLPVGQYRARLLAEGLDQTMPFKVVAAGSIPPDGLLHALLHDARVQAGQPARIDAWFTNTGKVVIRSAVLKLEAREGTPLLAALQSDALAVQPGQSVNLTLYWTPPSAGTYTLRGEVLYDGFLTPASESLLNVEGGGTPWWLWAVLAFLVLAAVVLALVLVRQRRAAAEAARTRHPAPVRRAPPPRK
jgi:hypothetical protein